LPGREGIFLLDSGPDLISSVSFLFLHRRFFAGRNQQKNGGINEDYTNQDSHL
jgi:hypothetical protein